MDMYGSMSPVRHSSRAEITTKSMSNQPLALPKDEIHELAAHPGLHQMWGATSSEEMEDILRQIYTVEFQFMSGSPGYVGNLFIIHGDALDASIPVVRLFRNSKRHLEILL